jgi:hypothetical protein
MNPADLDSFLQAVAGVLESAWRRTNQTSNEAAPDQETTSPVSQEQAGVYVTSRSRPV